MRDSVVLVVLAGAVLVLVAFPLVRGRRTPSGRTAVARDADADDDPAALALREIELDRAMGKLSDADYAALRSRYEAALAARPAPPDTPTPAPSAAGSLEERAEALVRRWRSVTVTCPSCGVRPEPEARYCSNCGRYLPPCPGCGRVVAEAGARFCIACGASLAG